MPIDITRPVELEDGTPLLNVHSYDLNRSLFIADLPVGASARLDNGSDFARLFHISDGRHRFCTLPNARNVTGERAEIPEREEEPETVSLCFDPMQPVELSDGTPCHIRSRDVSDTDYETFRIVLLENSSQGHEGGVCYWVNNNTGHVSGDLKLRNVDQSVPPHIRKARRDYCRVPDDLKPDFLGEDWFAPHADIHFPMLVERDEVAMVSFFENERKLESDRRTEMRVGRYVRRFNGGKLKDEDVEKIAAASDVKLRGNRVKITQDADEIEDVYVNGPNSCMSDDCYSYDTDGIHPSRVYAGPDLGIAYIGEATDASSRCVVWPERKLHGRIYGDETRMAQMLQQLGYESGSMRGARVRLIQCDEGIVMPYVDGINGASIDRANGVCILGGGHDLDTCNTNGLGGEDNRVTCERCEGRVDDDETSRVETSRHGVETWCEGCTDCHAVYCETYDYGCYVDEDRAVEAHSTDGEVTYRPDWSLGNYVEVTAGDHADEYWHTDATAEYDGEVYHVDDLPEGAEIDREGVATVEEAKEAGQPALPIDAPGEFRLMGDDTRQPDYPPFECVLRNAGGPPYQYGRRGTLAECEKAKAELEAIYAERGVRYWIEPVAAPAQFRVRRTGQGTTGHCWFTCIGVIGDDERSGTYADALRVQAYLTEQSSGRHVYTIEPVVGAPEDNRTYAGRLAIAA
jgi:hypothetical protein